MVRKIKAKLVLQLRTEGLSGRAIAASQQISRTSVAAVFEAADAVGVRWGDVADLREGQVYSILFPGRGEHESIFVEADRAQVHREMARVGQVDPAPKKRPKSSYIPFVRATAMASWQLDAFEYRLADGQTVTVYHVIDDATRYDVGTWAHTRGENSADIQHVLRRAIDEHGAPQELLSDNSSAFNQLRSGTIGSVEVFLASRGTMPITGLPGRPTTQGKNEHSHQTLTRFPHASRPATLEQLRERITRWQIGLVGTASPASWYRCSGDPEPARG